MWTSLDGRTFEGSLVSAEEDQAIIQRLADASYFQIKTKLLCPEDIAYVEEQILRATKSKTNFAESPKLYTLDRKLDIKGFLTRVPAPTEIGGWRQERTDPAYWFLLSDTLHGAEPGSIWVRVDEKTFRSHSEKVVLTREQLANFINAKGDFSDSLPWARPEVTIIEAQYGSRSERVNVTHKLMALGAQNKFPLEIQASTFKLPLHELEAWELTILWRTPTGEVRRTLRDGSVLTWP